MSEKSSRTYTCRTLTGHASHHLLLRLQGQAFSAIPSLVASVRQGNVEDLQKKSMNHQDEAFSIRRGIFRIAMHGPGHVIKKDDDLGAHVSSCNSMRF